MQALFLQLALIAVNAVFACAEIAVVSMNENKIAKLTEKGNKKAMRLSKLTRQPARFLATIQVGITLAGYIGAAFAGKNFSGDIALWLSSIGLPFSMGVLESIATILVTLILSFVTLIFGELVPKRLAMKHAESLALAMSGLVTFVSKVFFPVVWLLTVTTNGILRLLRVNPNEEGASATEEEIRLMLDAAGANSDITVPERVMIQNIFEFDDMTAGDIMTHRLDTQILWLEEFGEKWEDTIHNFTHTFYPICDDNIDNITGVLNTKHYFRLEDKSLDNVMKEAVRPVYFVPETVHTNTLFFNMQKSKNHFAVVLDEYGGFIGIVTINDLLEQLVGDLDDNSELPEEGPPIQKLDDNLWRISGETPLSDISEALNIDLPDDNAEILAGLVFSINGYIPDDGTSLEVEGFGLKVNIDCIADHSFEYALVNKIEQKSVEETKDSADTPPVDTPAAASQQHQ